MTFQLMEPELEELLQTIAADPRSSLLRVDRPTILRGLFDRDPMVRESCTQLTSAERQLLRVHRHELGRLLHGACFSLLAGNSGEVYSYCLDQGGGIFPPLTERQEAERAAIDLSAMESDSRIGHAVRRAVASSNPLTYATLACRVLPATKTFLLLSDCYQLLQDRGRDLKSLEYAYAFLAGGRDRAHILSYLGCHLMLRGRLAEAAEAYQASFHTGARWPGEVLSWLALAVQTADESAFYGALDAMAETTIATRTLEEWAASQVAMRENGSWEPTSFAVPFWKAHNNISNEQAHYVLQRLFSPKKQ